MAFVSVKFQRITAYLAFILCVVLLYQVYLTRKDAVLVRKSKTLNDVEQRRLITFQQGVSGYGIRIGKKSLHLHERVNISSFRIRETILRKEIMNLKSKLLESENANSRLKDTIDNMANKENGLKEEIASLKAKNAILITQAKRSRSVNLLDQNFSSIESLEKRQYLKNKQNGLKKTHIKIQEDIPFATFAKTHVFEPDTHPRPKEYMFRGQRKETRVIKPIRKHIFEMQDLVIERINSNQSLQITREHLYDGVYRFDVNTGVDYELYFRHPRIANSIIPVRFTRGFSEPHIEVLSNARRQQNEVINLIIPLSGRLERFQNFIDLFIDICVKKDKNVFLTVVLYGEKDFKAVKRILQSLENEHDFRQYELIMRDKEFSRGRALHDGVIYWKGENPNVLMFFCDVDITFRAEFLRRCRAYTEPGKQVYYPVVFSLYNPKNVYEDGNIPEQEDQLRIDRPNGFWRTYGFGMTCQYRADYLSVGGFDLSIQGWGSEDQQLHSRYIARQGIRVIRAPDRDLFHYYHEKYCDPNLKWQQYRSCLGSKAKTEGTPAQIAMQLMKMREKYEGFDEKND